MPVHDWTRVSAGTFHAFHVSWISEIQASLNSGILPRDYYAQAEQIAGPFAPDILTLQATDRLSNGAPSAGTNGGGIALATAPPPVSVTASAEADERVEDDGDRDDVARERE